MAEQEALTTPYGLGPDSLAPKTASPQEQFLGQLSQIRVPQGPDAPSLVPQNEAQFAAPPPDPDAALTKEPAAEVDFFAPAMPGEMDFFAGAENPADAPSVDKPSLEQMTAELGPVEAAKRYVGDSLNRAKLSFATDDFERKGALENMYGKANVRVKNGEIEFRRPGDKAFRALDPKQIEYIDDAMDFARDAVETGIEGVGRVAGFVGGAGEGALVGAGAGLAAGPGALVASPVGAVTGGMMGGIAGQAVLRILRICPDCLRCQFLPLCPVYLLPWQRELH